MKNKRPHDQQARKALNNELKTNSTSAASQRQRLLKYLQSVSPQITVTQARDLLGLMHPPARIFELRKQGWRIDLHWIDEFDSIGGKHRNGLYVYKGKIK